MVFGLLIITGLSFKFLIAGSEDVVKEEIVVIEKSDTTKYKPPLFEYPGGGTGTLWYDFETGERGKEIKR